MKKVVTELNDDLHCKMRIRALNLGMTVKEYMTSLIENDVKEKEYPAPTTNS